MHPHKQSVQQTNMHKSEEVKDSDEDKSTR